MNNTRLWKALTNIISWEMLLNLMKACTVLTTVFFVLPFNSCDLSHYCTKRIVYTLYTQCIEHKRLAMNAIIYAFFSILEHGTFLRLKPVGVVKLKKDQLFWTKYITCPKKEPYQPWVVLRLKRKVAHAGVLCRFERPWCCNRTSHFCSALNGDWHCILCAACACTCEWKREPEEATNVSGVKHPTLLIWGGSIICSTFSKHAQHTCLLKTMCKPKICTFFVQQWNTTSSYRWVWYGKWQKKQTGDF